MAARSENCLSDMLTGGLDGELALLREALPQVAVAGLAGHAAMLGSAIPFVVFWLKS